MLQELQLCMVSEVECLFMSKWLVIFFFMDNIVALFKSQHQPNVTIKGKRLGTYTHSVPQRRDKAVRSG